MPRPEVVDYGRARLALTGRTPQAALGHDAGASSSSWLLSAMVIWSWLAHRRPPRPGRAKGRKGGRPLFHFEPASSLTNPLGRRASEQFAPHDGRPAISPADVGGSIPLGSTIKIKGLVREDQPV
jgi:hypothetical protein